jgi:hypothetical protein
LLTNIESQGGFVSTASLLRAPLAPLKQRLEKKVVLDRGSGVL